jgi:sterol desaturase/sphingolipid hydroxylase (fatty acid hydroxylase superfamily)
MLEILAFQVIAAILGTLSIGGADWLYHRGRIRQPLHSLWVSSSSTAICLPLLTWTIDVFLGVGVISWVLVVTFGAMMFLWMYRNLLKVRPVQGPLSGPGTLGSSRRPVPPSSSVNG